MFDGFCRMILTPVRAGTAGLRSPLTTYHSPLPTPHSPLPTHHSPLTTHHSPLTRYGRSALDKGLISEADIDARLENLYGNFDIIFHQFSRVSRLDVNLTHAV